MYSGNTLSGKKDHFLFADSIFILLICFYAFACWQGILSMSEHGALMDSDLQTYAQGMAGEAHPDLFGADPVLAVRSEANSIPNLQRMLANFLLKGEDFAGALLASGAIAILVFYLGWYLFGRLVFHFPALAATLSLLMGITVWTGWGTFWGINHSDPVPRVFYAAIFPFLLLLAMTALGRPVMRPLVMLLCGLSMWVHGLNALNCGAVFFCAFFFLKKKDMSLAGHMGNIALCLAAFLLPVLYYLWPSLSQSKSFDNNELALFQEFFNLRWHDDYSDFGGRLLKFFSPDNPPFLILLGGLASWVLIYKKSSGLLRELCRMFPFFLLAIALVCAFSWLEGDIARKIGRLPMGHELVRGIRFLTPLSWIMLTGLLALYLPRICWRLSLGLVLAGVLVFSVDRQYVAAQYFVYKHSGIPLPHAERGELEHARALESKNVVEMLKRSVPPGQAIFSDEDMMSVRYLAMRPLAHAFKDGYVFFYNKDYEGAANWLKLEKILRSSPEAYVEAWLQSGAPWFLSRKEDGEKLLAPYARLADQSGQWRLYARKEH